MSETLHTAPLLSTPAQHIFEAPEHLGQPTSVSREHRSDEQIYITYEIERTIAEIRKGKWSRIALQFPDEMLPDAPRVSDILRTELGKSPSEHDSNRAVASPKSILEDESQARPYILADTSYGACCVDEVASEHIDAEVVVHYGRSCLSPTARLPVIYAFTKQPLEIDRIIEAFEGTCADKDCRIIVMADIPFTSHLPQIGKALRVRGYTRVFLTDVIHNPSSALPNRTVPPEVEADTANLKRWELFHVADPPEALLLTLSSRVSRIHIYPTASTSSGRSAKPLTVSTTRALKRRYAVVTSVSTVPIFGILINTLSVKNYIHIVEHVKSQILAAGKKSYTFVVGKINAAKVANFSEIGAWVVIGCWESSLIESKDFWKPVINPFELEFALARDDERIWTGNWSSDFQEILDAVDGAGQASNNSSSKGGTAESDEVRGHENNVTVENEDGDIDLEESSSPPEFDLRTGRLVSQSRPMQPSLIAANRLSSNGERRKGVDRALTKHAKGELAVIGGEASPGADFLRSKRAWKGLGSDFEIAYDNSDQAEGAAVEEGRSGIARGYVHSDDQSRT